MFGLKRKLLGGIVMITFKKCTVAALVLAVVFCTVFGTVYVKGGALETSSSGKNWESLSVRRGNSQREMHRWRSLRYWIPTIWEARRKRLYISPSIAAMKTETPKRF